MTIRLNIRDLEDAVKMYVAKRTGVQVNTVWFDNEIGAGDNKDLLVVSASREMVVEGAEDEDE